MSRAVEMAYVQCNRRQVWLKHWYRFFFSVFICCVRAYQRFHPSHHHNHHHHELARTVIETIPKKCDTLNKNTIQVLKDWIPVYWTGLYCMKNPKVTTINLCTNLLWARARARFILNMDTFKRKLYVKFNFHEIPISKDKQMDGDSICTHSTHTQQRSREVSVLRWKCWWRWWWWERRADQWNRAPVCCLPPSINKVIALLKCTRIKWNSTEIKRKLHFVLFNSNNTAAIITTPKKYPKTLTDTRSAEKILRRHRRKTIDGKFGGSVSGVGRSSQTVAF